VKLIAARRLAQGDRLPPERDLAKALGVSRTTLRDALRGLAERGILHSRQGSGWYVKLNSNTIAQSIALHFRLSDMTLGQMIEARRVVEPAIAACAAERRTDEELAALEALLAAMEATEDDAEYVDLDHQFHALLGVAAHNPFFALAVQPMHEMMQDLRRHIQTRWKKDASMEEHRRVMDALRRQDAAAAHAAMAEHLDHFEERAGELVVLPTLVPVTPRG
jgi:DNA-binding FadR family transcriptional regulator